MVDEAGVDRRPRDLGHASSGSAARVEIAIGAAHVLAIMLICIAVIVLLGMISAYVLYVLEAVRVRPLARGFLLDAESNLPTLFSFSQLILCAVLLAAIALHQLALKSRYWRHWALLAALFFLMAFDEAAMLHERLIAPVHNAFDTTGLFYFAWVIPGLAVVVAVLLLYLRFLLALPKPFMQLFLLSGGLYVGGALGVEMLEGAYAEVHGIRTFGFQIFATIEEAFEMLGLAVFAYTLLRYLGLQQDSVRLALRMR